MTGEQESETTYPVFYRGLNDELVFSYRDGHSGEGNTIFNVYDEKTQVWKRMYDVPLIDGQGRMSAYFNGPERGPDGYFHMTWVWRDSIMAETNHDLSYMRSRDLQHWETANGAPVALPVSPDNREVIVDPIPVRGGILNGSGKIGFDLGGRLVISYFKFDSQGDTQLYFARRGGDGWEFIQASQWKYRWEIQGGGSLVPEIQHGPLTVKDGLLTIAIRHVKEGNGEWQVDADSLVLKGKAANSEPDFALPDSLRKPLSPFPGMRIQMAQDSGESGDGYVYRLRWESLGPNRDKPRPKPWPEPSMLYLAGWKK
jgi:hypothetical protein